MSTGGSGRVSSWIKRSCFDRQVGLCEWCKLSTYYVSFALHSTTINTKVGENTENYKETYNCSQPSNNQIYYCFLKAIVGTKDGISSQNIHSQGKTWVCFLHTDNMVQLSYEGTPCIYKCGATLLLAGCVYLSKPSLVDPHSSLVDRRKLPVWLISFIKSSLCL